MIALVAAPAWGQSFVTDASAPGTAFSPGVRGQALPAATLDGGQYWYGLQKGLEVTNGSSIRGIAGGLDADFFNWKTRNNQARPGTLEYLRYSRDRDASLYITSNIRGLGEPDPANPGKLRYYDTSIPTLAALAADQVRYTNHIVQTYRQGQTITDPRDQAILDSLVWSSSYPGDSWDKLLRADEAAVPKVKHWEIGNEPCISVSYGVSNSYTFLAPPAQPDATHKTDFRERYTALTAAMLAEDPTIKVGPAIVWLNAASEQAVIDTILRQQPDGSLLPVDFFGYHPYQYLNQQTMPDGVEAGLRGIYNDHVSKINLIRWRISAAGRDPNSIALAASEYNASDWSSNDTPFEANMAHALGNTETVFTFARLGVQDAHYWIWPADPWDGTENPNFLAYEMQRDHMGDTLLNASASSTDNLHLYTTRCSQTRELALWALNFDNDTAITRDTPLLNVGGRGRITRWTLGALVGPTSLSSSNLSSYMAGGPTHEIDWTSADMTGQRLDNLQLTFGSATITVLAIEAWRQMSLPGDVNVDGMVNALDSAIITTNNNTDERNWWQGDVTGDGLVNSLDAAIVSANDGVIVGTKWVAQEGSWTTKANWQRHIPNSVGASAYLADSITAARDITLDQPITLGQLVFDNLHTYDLVGGGSLNLQATGSAAARVYVIQGDQRINVPLALVSSAVVDIAGGASLGADGGVSGTGALTKLGAGALNLSKLVAGGLQINAGTVRLQPSGPSGGDHQVDSLAIDAGAALGFELGGPLDGEEYARLDVAGLARLDGTLEIRLVNGFVPAAGDSFEVLAASSLSGTFTNVTLPSTPPLPCVVQYGATFVRLIVTVPLPPDLDHDGDMDRADLELIEACMSGPNVPPPGTALCRQADFDFDLDVDQVDFGLLQGCLSGPSSVPYPACMK